MIELTTNQPKLTDLFNNISTYEDEFNFVFDKKDLKKCEINLTSSQKRKLVAHKHVNYDGAHLMIIIMLIDPNGNQNHSCSLDFNEQVKIDDKLLPRIVEISEGQSTDPEDYKDLINIMTPTILNGSVIIRKNP